MIVALGQIDYEESKNNDAKTSGPTLKTQGSKKWFNKF